MRGSVKPRGGASVEKRGGGRGWENTSYTSRSGGRGRGQGDQRDDGFQTTKSAKERNWRPMGESWETKKNYDPHGNHRRETERSDWADRKVGGSNWGQDGEGRSVRNRDTREGGTEWEDRGRGSERSDLGDRKQGRSSERDNGEGRSVRSRDTRGGGTARDDRGTGRERAGTSVQRESGADAIPWWAGESGQGGGGERKRVWGVRDEGENEMRERRQDGDGGRDRGFQRQVQEDRAGENAGVGFLRAAGEF